MADSTSASYPNISSVGSANGTASVSETAQQLRDGPVAANVKDQTVKTTNEFQNLANSRTTPPTPAATGQPLTHYHSMFYSLLSWENPRASAVSYLGLITFIFMARYMNIVKYLLKLAYIALGTTAAFEVLGKFVLDQGLASRFRPKRYYTIPREALEASLEDVEQLLNFFIIEAQRIVFAENVAVTLAAFFASLVSFGLIKLLPLWGLSLIATTCVFFLPLVYITHREEVDGLVDEATSLVNAQASQLREVTAQRAEAASKSFKSYAGEYSSRAQGFMRASSPAAQGNGSAKSAQASLASTMPSVPKQEPGSFSSVERPVAAH